MLGANVTFFEFGEVYTPEAFYMIPVLKSAENIKKSHSQS